MSTKFSRPAGPASLPAYQAGSLKLFLFPGPVLPIYNFMARILLIDPPFSAFMGFSRWFFPMGPAVLANFLGGHGHEVIVYDADHVDSEVTYSYSEMVDVFEQYRRSVREISHPAYQAIGNVVSGFDPDIVGITCMSVKMPAVFAIAGIVKQMKDVPVVCGGPHATKLPENVLSSPHIDYVIRESGLASFDLLVDRLTGAGPGDLRMIPNLSYRSDGGGAVHNPVSHRDWDSMSWAPAREALRAPGSYTPRDLSMIMASIGCPFKCQFCSRTFDDQLVHRKVEDVWAEIDTLTDEYDVDFLHFKDDTMGTNRKVLEEICSHITANESITGWECLTRIDVADDATLGALKRARCSRIKVGVESGSPDVLRRLNKKITPDDVIEFSKRARKHNLPWSAFYMIGLPDETSDDIQMTIELIEKSGPDHVSISIFTPYPGSYFFDELLRAGRLPDEIDWSTMDPFSLAPQFKRAIPHDEFVDIAREVMSFVDRYNAESRWQDRV